jgi:hypothetical protein
MLGTGRGMRRRMRRRMRRMASHAAGRGPPCGGKAEGRPPVRRHAAERPPRAAACGGAAPRAAAPAGYGPRPMLDTGPAQWPVEIRVGLEGGGPVSPGCLRCGPLPSADCWPSALSRGCGSRLDGAGGACVRTQFPL